MPVPLVLPQNASLADAMSAALNASSAYAVHVWVKARPFMSLHSHPPFAIAGPAPLAQAMLLQTGLPSANPCTCPGCAVCDSRMRAQTPSAACMDHASSGVPPCWSGHHSEALPCARHCCRCPLRPTSRATTAARTGWRTTPSTTCRTPRLRARAPLISPPSPPLQRCGMDAVVRLQSPLQGLQPLHGMHPPRVASSIELAMP